MSLNETEVAERIRDGTLESPYEFKNMTLVNLRLTGTGTAYRAGLDEYVFRDPSIYLNEEFLKRCNGVPVVINHPPGPTLTEEEYKKRSAGSVVLPYIKGDEVWGVCRIYIKDIIKQILDGTVSTSPDVVFDYESGNVMLEAGTENILIEGTPFLIDHFALVTKDQGTLGVWDKNGIPQGIENTTGNNEMTDEELKQTLAEALAGVCSKVDAACAGMSSRMDAMEKADAARKDAAEKAEKAEIERADKSRKGAAEAETKKKEEDEKAKADKARKDALEAEELAAADKSRKDAADKEAAEKSAAETAEKDEKDTEAKADAQAYADSAYAQIGKRARSPMSGETVLNYRKRMMKGLQSNSATYKEVNLDAINDPVMISIAEKQIYADAAQASRNPAAFPQGTLTEFSRLDEAGRKVKTFRGDIGAFIAPFTAPAMEGVKFNTPGSNH